MASGLVRHALRHYHARNVAVGSDAHFSQLARAASALDPASASAPSVAALAAVSASSCPPPK
eukprot:5480503-Pleurochrysis_carterae.AAC.1